MHGTGTGPRSSSIIGLARSEIPCLRRDRSNIPVARVLSPSARHGRAEADDLADVARVGVGEPPREDAAEAPAHDADRLVVLLADPFEALDQPVDAPVGEADVGALAPAVHPEVVALEVAAEPAGHAVGRLEARGSRAPAGRRRSAGAAPPGRPRARRRARPPPAAASRSIRARCGPDRRRRSHGAPSRLRSRTPDALAKSRTRSTLLRVCGPSAPRANPRGCDLGPVRHAPVHDDRSFRECNDDHGPGHRSVTAGSLKRAISARARLWTDMDRAEHRPTPSTAASSAAPPSATATPRASPG